MTMESSAPARRRMRLGATMWTSQRLKKWYCRMLAEEAKSITRAKVAGEMGRRRDIGVLRRQRLRACFPRPEHVVNSDQDCIWFFRQGDRRSLRHTPREVSDKIRRCEFGLALSWR